jgi:hypothetical protein
MDRSLDTAVGAIMLMTALSVKRELAAQVQLTSDSLEHWEDVRARLLAMSSAAPDSVIEEAISRNKATVTSILAQPEANKESDGRCCCFLLLFDAIAPAHIRTWAPSAGICRLMGPPYTYKDVLEGDQPHSPALKDLAEPWEKFADSGSTLSAAYDSGLVIYHPSFASQGYKRSHLLYDAKAGLMSVVTRAVRHPETDRLLGFLVLGSPFKDAFGPPVQDPLHDVTTLEEDWQRAIDELARGAGVIDNLVLVDTLREEWMSESVSLVGSWIAHDASNWGKTLAHAADELAVGSGFQLPGGDEAEPELVFGEGTTNAAVATSAWRSLRGVGDVLVNATTLLGLQIGDSRAQAVPSHVFARQMRSVFVASLRSAPIYAPTFEIDVPDGTRIPADLRAFAAELLRNAAKRVLTDQPAAIEMALRSSRGRWNLTISSEVHAEHDVARLKRAAVEAPRPSGSLGWYLMRRYAERRGWSLQVRTGEPEHITVHSGKAVHIRVECEFG